MILPPVLGAKSVFSAGEQLANRADGNAERRRDLNVGVPGVAQQQAFALPLGYFGQRPAYRGAFFLAHHNARGTDQVTVDRLFIAALEATDALQAATRPSRRAQPIERQ